MNLSIVITPSAQVYLKGLLDKQEKSPMNVRIFVEKPGTAYAECCMAYCHLNEQQPDDVALNCEGFIAWIESSSLPFLEDATVDYAKERMGGQLTFRAPKSKIPRLGADATIEERINHVLYAEVNPSLASHGGIVTLKEVIDNGETAILQFGGGCQGCSAVDVTLKQGVEKTLLEQIPELKRIQDATDHSQKDHAYYH